MFLLILMTVVLMRTRAVLVFRIRRVWLDIKAHKMSQFRSLFPQELQATKVKDIGIKDWLLQKEVQCIFHFFPRTFGNCKCRSTSWLCRLNWP